MALAYAHLRAKRYADAMESRGASNSNIPIQPKAMHSRATCKWRKKYVLAARVFEQALSLQKTGRLLIGLHSAQSLAKLQPSEKPLVEWLRDNPASIDAREYLAGIYLDSGREKDAIEQYKMLLKSDPKRLSALNNLAWMLQDKNANEALDYAQRAFQIKGKLLIADPLGWL